MHFKLFKNNTGSFTSDFLIVLSSQIIVFLAGILTIFILPKIFDKTSYGYIRSFIMYTSYVGLLYFGISDGIHLKYAGIPYEKLDKKRLRFFTNIFLIMEIGITILIIIASLLFVKDENKLIFCAIGCYVTLSNFSGYSQNIAVVSSKFKLISVLNLIIASLKTLLVIVLLGLYIFNRLPLFYWYIIFFCIIYAIVDLIYIISLNDCFFGSFDITKELFFEYFSIMGIGIPLLFSNLFGQYIGTIEPTILQLFHPVSLSNAYSYYAFSSSLATILAPLVSAITLVIFPYLRKKTIKYDIALFIPIMNLMLILIAFSLLAYYPMKIFIPIILPQYKESFSVFRILFPGMLIRSICQAIFINYFKLHNKIKPFLIITIIDLILMITISCLLENFLLTKIVDPIIITEVYATVTVCGSIVWYFFLYIYLEKIQKNHVMYIHYILLILLISYYLISSLDISWYLGLLSNSLVIAFIIIIYRNNLKNIINLILYKNIE